MSANDLNASRDRSAVRRPTAWLAAVGVVVLLAAAFALSYDAFVALARAGGVNARLARYYPVVFDAMMVVALAAIFVLRTARVYVRLLTWLSAFLILAVCAGAGAVYAAEIDIPRRPLAAAVAVAPFLLLVLAFRLWLTMLRHIRRGVARRRSRKEIVEYGEPERPEPRAAARRRDPETRPISPLALPPAAPSAAEAGSVAPTVERPVRPPEPEPEEPAGAEPEPVPEPGEESEPARAEEEAPGGRETTAEGADVETREPTLEDLAAVVEFADLGEPVASLEPDEADLDEDRPPLPRRRRVRPGEEARFGEEDELVADDEPQSDPVTDEAESDEVDEFAALEDDEPERDEVPPPPSGRVRSSPLPPLDWGPGLGGLTGRRRTPRPQDESDTA